MAVSLIKKLSTRELTGRFALRRCDVPWKPFTKIPGRMCYRLRYLVPSCILEEGYVFLGFSKSGHFVLSYSLQIGADEHSAYPDHVYRLQWWLFIPCKRLQLVSEVRLFGEENIFHSLFIAYCEWPEDRTKITIYGHSTPPAGEDGCQCYLTVTAVPSLGECHDCQVLSHALPQVPSVQQCLRHSFCVHSKFELAPPFPFFSPRVQLRVDGIAVLNTGDSIVAIQVDTQLPLNSFDTEGRLAMEEDEAQSGAGLDKIILGSDLSIFGTVSTYFTEQEDPGQELSPKQRNNPDSPLLIEEEEENFYSADISELSDTDQSESKSTKSSCDRSRAPCEKCVMAVSTTANNTSRPGSNCGCSALANHRPALRTKNVSNSNNESTAPPLKTGSSHFHASHECLSPKSPKSPKSSGLSDAAGRVSHMLGQTNSSLNLNLLPSTPLNERSQDTAHSSENIMSPPPPLLQVQSPSVDVGSSRSQGDADDLASVRLSSQRSFFSPSSSAASDCQSQSSESVIVHTTHTRTVTFSIRRFSTHDQEVEEEEESPTPGEDDYDLAYKSILPVQVVWNKKPLNIIRTVRNDMSLITVLQMTFDIEHYMVEAIRHDADWSQRYVAFCNYDLQILDVCPSSQSVYGTVYALIQAKESLERSKPSRTMVKLYQTQFTFVFSLCTGLYSTLFIEPLTEVDEKILRGRDWSSPGSKECCLLRRKAAVPQSFYNSVHVLSNESVFKDKSLSMLISPYLYTAIML